jgi:hypothetical protein
MAYVSRILRPAILATLVVSSLAAGCQRRKQPDLEAIYNQAASYEHVERHPVIVIPGLLGSNLEDESGNVVWGSLLRQNVDPSEPEGARIVALPMREGAPLHELRDDVRPSGVLDRFKVKILGLTFQHDAYFNILAMLGAGGYRDEDLGRSGAIDYGDDHYTCFQFDYDWRRDMSEIAADLAAFIEQKKEYVRAERSKRGEDYEGEVVFDIVAHSVGGLLTRYYLRYGKEPLPEGGFVPPVTWAGARNVEHVVLVAPPNAGTVRAFRNLVRGVKLGPTFPRYMPAVLGTMPAAYQSLPRGRHGAVVDPVQGRPYEDLYDPDLWEEQGWGLASAGQSEVLEWLLPGIDDAEERSRVARDHLRKSLLRARQFAAAIDAPAELPDDLSLYLIAGDTVPTPSVVAFDSTSGEWEVVKKEAGDGKVLRSSALMDERRPPNRAPRLVSPIDWSQVMFLSGGHLGMTKDPAFSDNVLFFLLER